jgi:energy-coupling factor transporter ATP-binding protein EcfA2
LFEQLEVHNYQRVSDVSVVFGKFTVIVGPSGRGKSSFLRALTSLCFNQTGDRFVRHGKKKATARLTFDGGRVIEWEKPRDKGATYALDDQLFTRTGRAVPREIEEVLRVRRVDIDKGYNFKPQFHLQLDQPLLLSESASTSARALAKLTKLEIVVEAQINCKRDRGRAERQAESASEEVIRVKDDLSKLPNMKKAKNLIEQSERALKKVADKLNIAIEAGHIADDITGSLLLSDVTLPSDKIIQSLADRLASIEKTVDAAVHADDVAEQLVTLKSESEEAEITVAGVEESYTALVKELGACPLCGSTETWGKHEH